MRPLDLVWGALDAHECRPRGTGGKGHAKCPAHDGRDFDSLSFAEADDGRVLLSCHSRGCTYGEIMAAIGLDPKDGFPDDGKVRSRPKHAPKPRKATTTTPPRPRGPLQLVASYEYYSDTGRLAYVVDRLVAPDGRKTFRQRRPDGNGGWIHDMKGVQRILYHADQVDAAPMDEIIWVTEGEKDCDALVGIGLTATTSPQGAGKAAQCDLAPLRDRHVVIVPDNDEAGRKHAQDVARLAAEVGAASIRILDLPDLPDKGDVSDWLVTMAVAS